MEEDQKIFQISTDISLRREDFGGLVFIPITGEILQLNHTGYDLLKHAKNMDNFQANSEDSIFWQELERIGVIREVISHGRH
ncbi:MAG: hypothetical protein KKG75_02375 [Nanoarchaeota archaeon]|nr:hypothetical protein [Nanoarchaeota archaeon]